MEAPILTVSEISGQIRTLLETEFRGVWIEGEVSNFRPHSSGHQYFTLKDSGAQISCAMFRGQSALNRHRLVDGQLIQAFGNVSLYPARGQHQLIVEWIRPQGQGSLQARFEALKLKLESEGLFDPARKKALPNFPRTVAIVTSPTGAALQDILQILGRRAPWLRILVFPVRVQGDGAGLEIAEAVNRLASNPPGMPALDVIIVGRGGGSIEDLWAFNEEVVARSLAACPIPVISAVGHEIDFTIADFVADLRAPTPSAAAELVVPDGAVLRRRLDQAEVSLLANAQRVLENRSRFLALIHQALRGRDPSIMLGARLQTVDYLCDRLEHAVNQRIEDGAQRLEAVAQRLAAVKPGQVLQRAQDQLDAVWKRLARAGEGALDAHQKHLESLRKMVQALGPQGVLERGYSLTLGPDGELVTDPKEVPSGTRLVTRVRRGEIRSVVE